MYKVIVSQKKESTLNHWNESFLKPIPSCFILTSTWNISILPPLLAGLNENANSFFATRCHICSGKIAVFPVTLYTKQHCAHKRCFIRHYRHDEMKMKSTNRTNQRRLASHKGGVWKNESLSESFGSRWASKVKKKMFIIRKCFLTLHACQPVVGDSQNQNMNLSLPIIGAL